MQQEKDVTPMEKLRDYASYLLKNQLDQFAEVYLLQVKYMRIPIMKLFGDLSDEQLFTLARKSMEEFLESLKNGTAVERLMTSLKNWEEDKLEQGLSKEDILPSDIIQLSRAQAITLTKFIPLYTSDVEKAIAMVDEISAYYTKVQEMGFSVYQRIKQESEANLSKSEERFRIVVDSVKEYAIFRLDTEGYIRTWNLGAQRLKGYTANEIIGKHFSTFYPKEDIASGKPERELKIALRDGQYEEESWRIRKDGSRFWANVVITPIFSAKGNHVGFVKVTRDQTERMLFIQTLQKKNDELASYIADIEQFAYISSHDLKEPLRMVASYTQLLLKHCEPENDETKLQFKNFITEGVERMYSLLNDLIEYAGIRMEFSNPESVELNQILETVKKNLSEEINASNATVKTGPLPEVKSSPKLMYLLFVNLVENAIKFRKNNEPPVIEINAVKNNGFWTFSVKDNGIGIDPEYHETIFSIFKRLHPREEYPGTGMGLAICKKIVELHEGWIWLESEIGTGSTFYFTLPTKIVNL